MKGIKEEDFIISINKRAARIVGERKSGQPLFMPCELGYSCPICGSPALELYPILRDGVEHVLCQTCLRRMNL